MPNERLMLLDGNGLIYRGYFALPPLTTSKGELVNAVFGFCSIVLRGIQDLKPDYVAVAFDLQAALPPEQSPRQGHGSAFGRPARQFPKPARFKRYYPRRRAAGTRRTT